MRKIIKHIFADNLNFILASLTYLVAHVIDYFFTVSGIRYTATGEGNPIIQGYIDHFGLVRGLLGYKALICIAIIAGLKAVDLAQKENKLKVKAEHILYGGAILTTSGGALWLLSW